jgi:hypothetical protein
MDEMKNKLTLIPGVVTTAQGDTKLAAVNDHQFRRAA